MAVLIVKKQEGIPLQVIAVIQEPRTSLKVEGQKWVQQDVFEKGYKTPRK